MSGSPLEGRFWGNLKEFYWFAKLMSKTMVALFARGNRDTAVKAMDEFNAHFVSDLSTVDQNMLNAGLTNIFDGSIAIEKIEGTIDDIYESDPDFAWDFPDRVKNFIKKFAKSQDKEEFLKDKTISALENRLSKEETGCLLTIWNAYYKYIANEINSRLQSTNSYEEDFSTIRRVLESAKFKDTKLGKEFASAWHKSDFIKNIIHLNVNNEKREMEELSILSHAWREIAKETSHEGYLTSEKAGKISDEYINEMRKYGNLLRDFIAQNSYYFNEYTISRTEDLLKNDRTKEAATEAFRAINNLHYTYTLRYSAWIKTYSFYYSKRIRFSEYLNEIGKLSDEIKETLSDLPLFPKESDIPTGKKIQEDKWGAAKESLNTVDKELRILENKKTIFEFLKELPSATTYLYARAVTTKEKTQLNKLKEEIRNFIDKSLGFRWSDMKEVERYLTKGEPRHIILATIKIGLMYAKEAGVESKEFHKWQSKAQTLAKQFQVPIVSSALAIEQYKELIEQVFSNYESGGVNFLNISRQPEMKSRDYLAIRRFINS